MTDDDRIALIDRHGRQTYAELWRRVGSMSGALRAAGVRPRDRVLVVTANERESVAAYHAVVRIGATAVLTHLSAGLSELRTACSAAHPVAAVLSPLATHLADQISDVPALPTSDLQSSAPPPPEAPAVDEPRLVLFTSGTTAVAKGVVHTGRSLRAATTNFQAMAALRPDDRLFLVSPLASITGVAQALELAPRIGAAAVLESSFDDEATLDLMLEAGATFYGGPDLVLDRLLHAAARRGARVPLRRAALGGTMLRRELLDRAEAAGIRVIRVYGSSEAPLTCGTRVDEPDDVRLTGEGTPGPGVELRIGDDGTNELLVRGPHLFAGYLDDAQTAEAMAAGWFRTGDEARLDDGRLSVVGRLKDVAGRNGRKISLAEVDAAFTAATGITECAAFTVPDEQTGNGSRWQWPQRTRPDSTSPLPSPRWRRPGWRRSSSPRASSAGRGDCRSRGPARCSAAS